MRAKAVVFTDRLQVEVQQIELPDPGPREVVIDVEYSWISNGTEGSFLRGERIAGDTPYREGDPWPFPIVAGYQKVGVIRQVGSEVQGFAAGDRVFATVSRVGDRMFDRYGGHVSPAITAADQLWKLPDGADPVEYSGLVLTQVGYNCGIRPQVTPGERAVVIGDGMVGQWAAQTLRHRGAKVVVLGRREHRLQLLPDEIDGLNVKQQPAAVAVKAWAEGDPIAVVVDTAGSMPTLLELFPLLGHDAHIVSAGFYGQEGHIDIQLLRNREITLHAPAGWNRERMDGTLKGIEERWLDTRPLITHRFPVDEAPQAWELIMSKSEDCLGVVLEW